MLVIIIDIIRTVLLITRNYSVHKVKNELNYEYKRTRKTVGTSETHILIWSNISVLFLLQSTTEEVIYCSFFINPKKYIQNLSICFNHPNMLNFLQLYKYYHRILIVFALSL